MSNTRGGSKGEAGVSFQQEVDEVFDYLIKMETDIPFDMTDYCERMRIWHEEGTYAVTATRDKQVYIAHMQSAQAFLKSYYDFAVYKNNQIDIKSMKQFIELAKTAIETFKGNDLAAKVEKLGVIKQAINDLPAPQKSAPYTSCMVGILGGFVRGVQHGLLYGLVGTGLGLAAVAGAAAPVALSTLVAGMVIGGIAAPVYGLTTGAQHGYNEYYSTREHKRAEGTIKESIHSALRHRFFPAASVIAPVKQDSALASAPSAPSAPSLTYCPEA